MCIGVVVPVAESLLQPACVPAAGVNAVYCQVAAPAPMPVPLPEKGGAGRHSRVSHVDVDDQLLGKTKLCKFFLKGHCSRGRACTFAHGRKELRAAPDLFKTEMCYEYTNRGWCHRGPECKYAHGEQELRWNQGMSQQTGSAVNISAPSKHQSCSGAPAVSGQVLGRGAVVRTPSAATFATNTLSTQEFSHLCSSFQSQFSDSSSTCGSTAAGQAPGSPEVESCESDSVESQSTDGELVWAIENTFFTLVTKDAQSPRRRRTQSTPPSVRI